MNVNKLVVPWTIVISTIIIVWCIWYLRNMDTPYVPGSQELPPIRREIEMQQTNTNVVTSSTSIQKINLVEYVMRKEGFLRTPKRDNDGTMIIGHSTSVEFARKCGWVGWFMTKKTAKRVLEMRLAQEANELYSLVPGLSNAPLNVQTAIKSMYFNGGPSLVGPNCRRFIAAKDWPSLAQEIALGHNPKGFYGLVKRRFEEASMVARLSIRTPKNMEEFFWVKQEMYPVV